MAGAADRRGVWPADSVAYHESTTALSNVVSLDESPVLEGLLYAGTHDGLLQVTEDGGKSWRKVDQFPACRNTPTCRRSCLAARRQHGVCRAQQLAARRLQTLLVKSTDRGRTFTNVTGNLPERHDVRAVIQDHVNGNLLFAGTEFGVYTSVDPRQRWAQLTGGMPVAQARDMTVQAQNDLVGGDASAAGSTCSTITAAPRAHAR